MPASYLHGSKRRGAIVMMLTVMLPFLLLPMVGLAIDATVIHIVQTRLSAAVDGAALGSGRLLGTQANISEIAGEFFAANFPTGGNGFWGATLPTNNGPNPTINVQLGTTKTITVNAVASVPTIFMRVLGFTQASVSAAAQATRRDSRIMLVIDRSGSMGYTGSDGNTAIADVQSDAAAFVKRFTPGADEMGLVVYDGSAVVAYPATYPYSSTVAASGGPDGNFWDGTTQNGSSTGGTGSKPDMVYQINHIDSGGATGTAEALTLAYIELQKAHLRDEDPSGKDDRLNSIVLFTDGAPSAVSVYANYVATSTYANGTWVQPSSNCTYQKDSSPATHPMYFFMDVGGGTPPPYDGGNQAYYQLASLLVNSTHSPYYWVTNAGIESNPPSTPSNYNGCGQWSSGNHYPTSMTSLSALYQIPTVDLWGNQMVTNAYQDSYYINGNGQYDSTHSISGGTSQDTSDPTVSRQWGIALWNAVDSAALAARSDANFAARSSDTSTNPMQITIYAVGYAHDNFGVDAGLLKRVANDWSNTASPNALPSAWKPPTQPQGMFVLATNVQELDQAFDSIASAILRLAK